MKVALTGGATGIGAETAAKLVAAGHEVTAFDIAGPAVAGVEWIACDLSDTDAIRAAAAQAGGPFDALVNNAELSPGAAIVNTASRAGAGWQENLDEVKALLALDPAELAGFVAARGIDATRAYNLSKEALIVLTMAETERMVARGFRMNSVSPGAVSTGILKDFAAAFGDRMARNVARAGRPCTPAEVADLILLLNSPQSAWIKGQDITIDGGMSAMAAVDRLLS